MALGIYEEEDIRALAEEIRYRKGGGSRMTVKEMKDEITNVKEFGFSEGWSDGYNSGLIIGNEQGRTEGLKEGKAIGYAEGKTDGIAEGKKSQYDKFWDDYQDYGNRYAYYYAFAGFGWTDDSFNPKYNIIPKYSGIYCFCYSKITDIAESLKKCGVVLDTTLCTDFSAFFAYSKTKTVPLLNVAAATSTLTNLCNDCLDLITIEKLIVSENVRFHSSTFFRCEALENLTIEGTIGQNDFNVQWSTKLTHDSLMSIIEHLSSTASGKTATFSKIAVNNAFETSEGLADGSTSEEWLNLIATKNNWTISLV